MQPNNNIQNLKPYLSIPHKIWNLDSKNDILKLDWNESTINPSPKVIKSLINFIKNGHLNWYPNTQNLELLELLRDYTNQDNISNIETFASSDAAHEAIIDTFMDKNSNICIITPTYDNFRARGNAVGINTINFNLDENFKLDFTNLSNFLESNHINMLYICSPNNPNGGIYDLDSMRDLIIKHSNILFLVDEAYYEFCNFTLEKLCKECENLIITRTFSKAFGLASFRIGYCISHTCNISHLRKLKNQKSITMLSQIAAISALKDRIYTQKYVKKVIESRTYFCKKLTEMDIKFYESYANFILIKVSDTRTFVEFLESKNIFIRDYSHILQNHCRITIGTKKQMKKVIESIRSYIEKVSII